MPRERGEYLLPFPVVPAAPVNSPTWRKRTERGRDCDMREAEGRGKFAGVTDAEKWEEEEEEEGGEGGRRRQANWVRARRRGGGGGGSGGLEKRQKR